MDRKIIRRVVGSMTEGSWEELHTQGQKDHKQICRKHDRRFMGRVANGQKDH
jgi:hypothetical protein